MGFFLFWFFKNAIGIFMGIALNQYIALDNTAIATILILPIYKHDFSIFLSSLISFNNALQFLAYRSFTCFIKFVWGILSISPA